MIHPEDRTDPNLVVVHEMPTGELELMSYEELIWTAFPPGEETTSRGPTQ